jgi:hypothetical protein
VWRKTWKVRNATSAPADFFVADIRETFNAVDSQQRDELLDRQRRIPHGEYRTCGPLRFLWRLMARHVFGTFCLSEEESRKGACVLDGIAIPIIIEISPHGLGSALIDALRPHGQFFL